MAGFILMKKGLGVNINMRNRDVVRLSSKLYIDSNKKIIGDVGWIASKLRGGINDKGGQDGNE